MKLQGQSGDDRRGSALARQREAGRNGWGDPAGSGSGARFNILC